MVPIARSLQTQTGISDKHRSFASSVKKTLRKSKNSHPKSPSPIAVTVSPIAVTQLQSTATFQHHFPLPLPQQHQASRPAQKITEKKSDAKMLLESPIAVTLFLAITTARLPCSVRSSSWMGYPRYPDTVPVLRHHLERYHLRRPTGPRHMAQLPTTCTQTTLAPMAFYTT
jgi:hypothetical protein